MKAELKQIGRGISATAVAAAAAAEELGMWEISAVEILRQLRIEGHAACAEDALQAEYIRHLASSRKFEDVQKSAELAAKSLVAKFLAE
jgi:hypothetical protein